MTNLPQDVSRCLAQGFYVGQSCPRADECQRHVQIRHDSAANIIHAPVAYRCCLDENHALFMPMGEA